MLLHLQRIPKAADLAPPAPAALVQPLLPPDDLESVDPKWFGFLEDGELPGTPTCLGLQLQLLLCTCNAARRCDNAQAKDACISQS
jgi:hypothetical protein